MKKLSDDQLEELTSTTKFAHEVVFEGSIARDLIAELRALRLVAEIVDGATDDGQEYHNLLGSAPASWRALDSGEK